jgi:hypothetical protein
MLLEMIDRFETSRANTTAARRRANAARVRRQAAAGHAGVVAFVVPPY